MTRDPDPALQPKLRFPEFRKLAGWKKTSLSSVLSEDKLKSDGKSEVHSVSLTKGVVSQMEHMGRSFSAADTSHYSLVRPFDVIYTKSPLAIFKLGIVKQHRGPHNALVSPLYGVFSPINRHVGQLIEAYFDSPSRSLRYLDPLAQKGAKNTIQISNERFLSGEMFLPCEEGEQQKIAECLSTLDELIGAEGQKLDVLQAHKKGLMHRLFPREGESLPRLRFPTGGDWTIAGLPEVAFFQEGPGIMAVDFRSEGVPLVRLAGVCGAVVTLDGCNYLDPKKVAQKWEHFRLAINDLIISTSATFGLSSIVTEAAAGAVFYTGLIRFRPTNERLGLGYLKAYLGSPHFSRQAESAAVGGGIKHFGPSHLKQMEIPIPPLNEQHRIATCLSSLDDLIGAQSNKLEGLKTHKKGLMQRLFPSPSEAET